MASVQTPDVRRRRSRVRRHSGAGLALVFGPLVALISPADAAAPPSASSGRVRVAAFALDGFDLPPEVEMAPVQLTTLLVSELERRGYGVTRPSLAPSDFALALECTSLDDACLAKMAKHFDVEAILVGSVARAGAPTPLAPAKVAPPAKKHSKAAKKKGGPKKGKTAPATAAPGPPAPAAGPVTLRVTLRLFSVTPSLASRAHDESHEFVPGSIAATVEAVVAPFLPPALPAASGPDPAEARGAERPAGAESTAAADLPLHIEGTARPARSLRLPAVVLAGVGVALLGVSLGTGLRTAAYNRAYEEGPDSTLDDLLALERTERHGRTMALVTDVVFVAGAALAATGAVLFALSFRGPRGATVVGGASPLPGGAAAWLTLTPSVSGFEVVP